MRRSVLAVALAAGMLAPATPAAASSIVFSDVPAGSFAAAQIRVVAAENDWMRAFGTTTFKPDALETRARFAIALVRAFDRFGTLAGPVTLTDVDDTRGDATAIKLAVERKWLDAPKGVFSPNAALTKVQMDVALVRALGLAETAASLAQIKTADGYRFKVPVGFGEMVMAQEMRFHANHSSEVRELLPWSAPRRSDIAFALAAAVAAKGSWQIRSMERYKNITLPAMDGNRRAVTEWALAWVGTPYIWAGEWANAKTPTGYPFGAQPQGGTDCSGYVWWVLHSKQTGYNPPRAYNGWYLPDRSSAQMGGRAPRRLSSAQITPMDILLFDSDRSGGDWRTIDHAGLALGNGWMIHSSGGRSGVTISWIGDGFWKNTFYFGRRVIPGNDPPLPQNPSSSPTPTGSPSPSPTPTATPTATPA